MVTQKLNLLGHPQSDWGIVSLFPFPRFVATPFFHNVAILFAFALFPVPATYTLRPLTNTERAMVRLASEGKKTNFIATHKTGVVEQTLAWFDNQRLCRNYQL
jgi:hypothetical protein